MHILCPLDEELERHVEACDIGVIEVQVFQVIATTTERNAARGASLISHLPNAKVPEKGKILAPHSVR